ncbi:MAG: hypothetical protein JWL73_1588 [Actinomycetia bacterium]|nr:hypothetical protein [Actinomycetes bacterium]
MPAEHPADSGTRPSPVDPPSSNPVDLVATRLRFLALHPEFAPSRQIDHASITQTERTRDRAP